MPTAGALPPRRCCGAAAEIVRVADRGALGVEPGGPRDPEGRWEFAGSFVLAFAAAFAVLALVAAPVLALTAAAMLRLLLRRALRA